MKVMQEEEQEKQHILMFFSMCSQITVGRISTFVCMFTVHWIYDDVYVAIKVLILQNTQSTGIDKHAVEKQFLKMVHAL